MKKKTFKRKQADLCACFWLVWQSFDKFALGYRVKFSTNFDENFSINYQALD